jgi:UDP-glucose 4-epimerase
VTDRVLVTGGMGYLGGRLGQHLARVGGRQVVLGSRSAGPSPGWLPEAAVRETRWDSDEALMQACASVDAVVHLAGMNAQDCAANPVAALESNGLCTGRLLRAAVRAGVRRFIHVSTAHVYGSPLAGVITERDATRSLHPYATSHRAGEDLVRYASERKTIEGIAIRLSNAFGTPAHAGANCWMLLVNDLCRQAVETGVLTLGSSGVQRRDFICIEDACRAIAHLLDLGADRLGDGLFNVGGTWAPTVLEMTERIANCAAGVLGTRPQIVRKPPAAGDVPADLDFRVDKLAATGFSLVRPIDAEIVGTIRFCIAHRASSPPV